MKDFSGKCHCGAIDFEVSAEISSLLECNCTICHKLGALWVFVSEKDIQMKNDVSKMSTYQFAQKRLTHFFCKVCGIETFASGEDGQGQKMFGINVRSLEGLDYKSLPVRQHDGLHM